jgi:hypothetical protein
MVVGPASVFAQAGDDDPVNAVEVEEDDSVFCTNTLAEHPIVAAIAARYNVDYEDVLAWFCEDGLGLGQIALALHTASVLAEIEDDGNNGLDDEPVTAQDLLEMRMEGAGWGQIWHDLGFVGRPRGESMGLALGRGHNDVEDDEGDDELEAGARNNRGRPDHAGRPHNPGSSNARGGGHPDNPGSSHGNGKGGR